jgi:predicted small secreted protein
LFVFNDTIISKYIDIFLLGGLFVNLKTFLIGVGAGVAAGIIVNQTVTNKGEISSEKALDIAKSAFKKHGPIQGSWIQMKKQPYHKSFLEYEVYIGGISRSSHDTVEQYEFIVDSKTGAILDAYLL